MKFIVKLFPEIMVKGNAVKKKMIGQLSDNLRTLLGRIDPSVEVKRYWDKLEVETGQADSEAVRKVLLQTPGIEQILQVLQYPVGKALEDIAEKVAQHAVSRIEGKTFVVRVKRTGNHDFSSFDAERFIGSYLFMKGNPKGVDLHHPQVKVEVEIHENELNIVTHRFPALGGFPMGTQGEILSLMSGGFDSTIASYLTMRRGLKTHFIFFNLGGAAHEIGVKQVALYLWSQFGASHRVRFVTVPFEEVVEEIFRSTHESYMGVTLKRQMLKAAEQIADRMGIDALLTGESVAQVSSQTLRNLAVIDRATDKLVLRPLATMDKPEIMSMADRIGTRHFAESMPEYCGVISKNPVINASFERMEKEAARFDQSVLDKAIEKAVTIPVDRIVEDVAEAAYVEVVHEVPDNAVVIDIRAEAEQERTPLQGVEAIAIPFYELNRRFAKLDADKEYLLYCDKGVMSQLHAQYLIDKGFDRVRVYRPKSD